jgi:hypothetical protein
MESPPPPAHLDSSPYLTWLSMRSGGRATPTLPATSAVNRWLLCRASNDSMYLRMRRQALVKGRTAAQEGSRGKPASGNGTVKAQVARVAPSSSVPSRLAMMLPEHGQARAVARWAARAAVIR